MLGARVNDVTIEQLLEGAAVIRRLGEDIYVGHLRSLVYEGPLAFWCCGRDQLVDDPVTKVDLVELGPHTQRLAVEGPAPRLDLDMAVVFEALGHQPNFPP